MFLGRSDGCTACGAAKLAIVVGIGAMGRHSTFWYPTTCTFGVVLTFACPTHEGGANDGTTKASYT